MQGIIERNGLKHAQARNERSHSMENILFDDEIITRNTNNIYSKSLVQIRTRNDQYGSSGNVK